MFLPEFESKGNIQSFILRNISPRKSYQNKCFTNEIGQLEIVVRAQILQNPLFITAGHCVHFITHEIIACFTLRARYQVVIIDTTLKYTFLR